MLDITIGRCIFDLISFVHTSGPLMRYPIIKYVRRSGHQALRELHGSILNKKQINLSIIEVRLKDYFNDAKSTNVFLLTCQ